MQPRNSDEREKESVKIQHIPSNLFLGYFLAESNSLFLERSKPSIQLRHDEDTRVPPRKDTWEMSLFANHVWRAELSINLISSRCDDANSERIFRQGLGAQCFSLRRTIYFPKSILGHRFGSKKMESGEKWMATLIE
ncbi:hypothetical protein TNCV_1789971 [Trichonephila clavipes]|nr:hypothetical protein TNCV_1789971 [Trichonephila clavipes]